MSELVNKIIRNERVSSEDALDIIQNFSTLEIGQLATLRKKIIDPSNKVSFVVDTNPNYTNICDTECLFCAFWRKKSSKDSYLLSIDKIIEIVKTSYHNGATTVLLQGGHNPDIALDYYFEIVDRVVKEVPGIHLHAFSAPEISSIAKYSKKQTKEILQRFWDLGLRTIPGGGAEVLNNNI